MFANVILANVFMLLAVILLDTNKTWEKIAGYCVLGLAIIFCYKIAQDIRIFIEAL